MIASSVDPKRDLRGLNILTPKSPRRSRPRATIATSSSAPQLESFPDDSPPTPDSSTRPAKRTRKAINCLPCRASKLKCDRAKPCSSCVLRGTTDSCFQDAPEPSSPQFADPDSAPIDPAHEFARVRHSLAVLEAHFLGHRPAKPRPRLSIPATPVLDPEPKKEDPDLPTKSVPGILAQQGQGGLYAGPTSTATHFLAFRSNSSNSGESETTPPTNSDGVPDYPPIPQIDYDRDLIELLPQVRTIDALIDYYFECCNWIYRHVHEDAFRANWLSFKAGKNPDRLVLAQACILMAVATYYLPADDPLLHNPRGISHAELGQQYYNIMRTALARHQMESRTLSLDLVELLLSRCHYLTLAKLDAEEIWSVRGELVSMAMAMGLHRDPGKWHMPRDVAERRKWAWWHILLLERWQAFTLGRPLSIASHHFDTHLPSYFDPRSPPADNRFYLPNVSLFQLARILGEIMDDAVSVRPIPYESVQENDRKLQDWFDTLPPELDLDEFNISRALASSDPSTRRLGVQSVIIRTSYFHIRFTLHRPYASSPHVPSQLSSQSLDTAVSCATKLIALVGQARPEFISNAALDVPGHMNWGPFHLFSAAMFFSFQLIANPDQPGAHLFRQNIRRVFTILEQAADMPVAVKAYNVLQALVPLYDSSSEETPAGGEGGGGKDKKKAHVLNIVRNLAFPCHDSPARQHPIGSPSRRSLASPATSSSSPKVPDQPTPVSATSNLASTSTSNPPSASSTNPTSYPPNAISMQNIEPYDVPSAPAPQPQPQPQISTPTSATSYYPSPTHPHPRSHPHLHPHPHPLPHSQTHPPPPHPLSYTSTSNPSSNSLSFQHQTPLPPNPYPYPYPSQSNSNSNANANAINTQPNNSNSNSNHIQSEPHSNHAYPPSTSRPLPVFDPVPPTLPLAPVPGLANEVDSWGASVGLGQDEWLQFLDVMQMDVESFDMLRPQ